MDKKTSGSSSGVGMAEGVAERETIRGETAATQMESNGHTTIKKEKLPSEGRGSFRIGS